MSWYQIAAVLVIVTFLLFGWALCRAASRGDDLYEEMRAKQWPPRDR